MNCEICHAALGEDLRCPSCGAKYTLVCPDCGRVLGAAKTCPDCGETGVPGLEMTRQEMLEAGMKCVLP